MIGDLNTDNTRAENPYDIALIRTKHIIRMNDDVKPILLINTNEEVDSGNECTLVGWGETRQDEGVYIRIYIYIYIIILSNQPQYLPRYDKLNCSVLN